MTERIILELSKDKFEDVLNSKHNDFMIIYDGYEDKNSPDYMPYLVIKRKSDGLFFRTIGYRSESYYPGPPDSKGHLTVKTYKDCAVLHQVLPIEKVITIYEWYDV